MEHACHTSAGAWSTCTREDKVFTETANPSPLPALAQGVHAGCICACVDGLQTLLRLTRISLTAIVWAGPLAPLATTHRMQWRERFQRTLHLWPYMAPLALVYFAEYVLQVRIMPANLDDATVLLF